MNALYLLKKAAEQNNNNSNGSSPLAAAAAGTIGGAGVIGGGAYLHGKHQLKDNEDKLSSEHKMLSSDLNYVNNTIEKQKKLINEKESRAKSIVPEHEENLRKLDILNDNLIWQQRIYLGKATAASKKQAAINELQKHHKENIEPLLNKHPDLEENLDRLKEERSNTNAAVNSASRAASEIRGTSNDIHGHLNNIYSIFKDAPTDHVNKVAVEDKIKHMLSILGGKI